MGFRNMYIAASAGSGKTYQLVNRFVALLSLQQLATGKPEVGRLIAITFSRKAAGEFKERILAALAEAAKDAQAATRFWEQRVLPTIVDAQSGICPGAELPPLPPLQPFFTRMLRALTDAFSELRLSTIDSLFHQLVNALAPELGLHSFATLDEARQRGMNRRTLDLTYLHQSGKALPELEAAVNDCFPSDERKDRPDANLLELVSQYHEAVLDAPDALWGGDADSLSDAELALFGLERRDVELRMQPEEFRDAVERVMAMLPEGAPAIWKSYVESLADTGGKLAAEPKRGWDAFCLQCKAAGLGLDDLAAARHPLYWRKLLTRTRAIRDLIAEFEHRYHADVRSRGLYSFSDVLHLLQARIGDASMQLVEERTDARLDHWLLDEFQDTSWAQYGILLDLLQNRASADDGSVFMVGDAKQSIYQFRGGDPRIFIRARGELFGLTGACSSCEESAQLPLDTSYRSTRPVLDFANELFGNIDITARNASEAARQLWRQLGYAPHKAAPHMAARAGCAAIYQADLKPEEDGPSGFIPGVDDQQGGNVLRSMAALLAEKRPAGTNCPVPGCAILVHTHAQERKIYEGLTLLQAQYRFEGPLVICNDNEAGSDSPSGMALSQLFRWLNTPADEASLSLLRLTPLWDALADRYGTAQIWPALHSLLAASGVSGLLRHVAGLCPQLCCNAFMQQRYSVWLNAADAFDSQGGTLTEWLTAMDGLKQREEPQGNAIRIMTIFKSKGLEFDMVLLPQFPPMRDMADATKVSLLQRRDAQGNTLAVLLRPVKAAMDDAPAVRAALYTPWQAEQEFSSFCQLYVAVTRAKYATYVIIPGSRPPATKSTLSRDEEILSGTREGESLTGMMLQLAHEADRGDGQRLAGVASRLYLCGDSHWECDWQAQQPAAPAPQPDASIPARFPIPVLERSTPSGRAAAARQHGQRKQLRYGQRNQGTGFGTLVHRCFEHIAWLAPGEAPQFPPAADAEEQAAQDCVQRALAQPAIHALFHRPAAPARLYREQGIEALREGNIWLSGQIDRLVVEYDNEGRPARARIIDYKSDACDTAALKPEYAPQMHSYRSMVALAFGLPEAAVGVTLIHTPRQGGPGVQVYGDGEL